MSVFNEIYDYKVAWAAGFFDGEGCICIVKQQYDSSDGKRKVTHRLKVTLTQNNYETLERFKEIVGVHGKMYKPRRTVKTNKQTYALHYDGKHAYQVTRILRPFLVRKGHEADAADRFWHEGEIDKPTGRKPVSKEILKIREYWYNKLKRMK